MYRQPANTYDVKVVNMSKNDVKIGEKRSIEDSDRKEKKRLKGKKDKKPKVKHSKHAKKHRTLAPFDPFLQILASRLSDTTRLFSTDYG